MGKFVHLHVHSTYSKFDGMAVIPALFERCEQLGMPGLALTDHGTIRGIREFLEQAAFHPSVKPIAGCEIYLTDHYGAGQGAEKGYRYFHLILLAKNETGFRNLCRIMQESFKLEGRGSRVFASHDIVRKYHEGLICTSACIGGEVAQAILEDDLDKARAAIRWYKDVFGDDFYLELDLHRNDVESRIYPKQVIVAKWIPILGHELKVKVIAANDVHYVHEREAAAHDQMLIQRTHSDPDDPDRFRYTGQEWLKSQEEMETAFILSDMQFVWNTMEVFEKIEDYRNLRDIALSSVETALMDAWKNRDRILGDEDLYCRQWEWSHSCGSFCGDLPMPIGLILECWLDNGPFILPDGRRVFQFQGGLSGACSGMAIDIETGKISPFRAKEGNDLSFPVLWRKRAEIWKAHKEKAEA